jgi:DNA (cytosine-5)-methyltransferase 1
MVFEEVCVDLESQGYEVQPILLPACSVGAPHRRDRIWFVAYSNNTSTEYSIQTRGHMSTGQVSSRTATNSNCIRQHERECDNEEFASEGRINAFNDINANDGQGNVTDSPNIGQKYALENGELERGRFGQSYQRGFWHSFPSQSPICGGNDGLPTELDGITFPKWRNESIKGYGNAIVPQVAYQIFKVIAEMDAREKAQMKLF